MPVRKRRPFHRRRLSSGREDADHAPDAGQSCEGPRHHPASQVAEDRPGHGTGWSTGQVVEIDDLIAWMRAGGIFANVTAAAPASNPEIALQDSRLRLDLVRRPLVNDVSVVDDVEAVCQAKLSLHLQAPLRGERTTPRWSLPAGSPRTGTRCGVRSRR